MSKCRITVVKRSAVDQALVDEYLADSYKEKEFGPCPLFKDG